MFRLPLCDSWKFIAKGTSKVGGDMRVLLFSFFLLIVFNISFAEENFIKGEYDLSMGYNFISKDKNPDLISEYSSLSSSPVFLLNFSDLVGHNKYSVDLNFFSKDDVDFKLSYDYKDSFRLVLNKKDFYHNMTHKNFSHTVDYFDYRPSDKYFLDLAQDSIFLKIRPTILPYHIRLYVENFDKKGIKQKRFYGRARIDSVPLDYNLYSTSKKYDLDTDFYQASMDGIIGGINFLALIEHANLRDEAFDISEGGNLLIVPSLTKEYKHIALYSNQTGQISFVFSFTNSEIKNNKRDELNQKSGDSTYNNSSAIFTYYPLKDLKFYLKLKYEDREERSPEKIRFLNIDYLTKNQIPANITTLLYGLVYNLNRDWKIKYEGKSKETKREFVVDNEWLLSNSVSLEGKIANTNIKIKETIENVQNPYYRDTPKSQFKTNFSTSTVLNERSGIDLDYTITSMFNDDINYYFQEGLSNSLTINYYYNSESNWQINTLFGLDRDRYKFDINIYGGGNIPNTAYKSTRLYGDLNVSKSISKKSDYYGDVFYQRVYGNYYPNNSLLTNEITNIDYYQYGLKLGNNIKITTNQLIKLEFAYAKHSEKTVDSYSGEVRSFYISWEKKW